MSILQRFLSIFPSAVHGIEQGFHNLAESSRPDSMKKSLGPTPAYASATNPNPNQLAAEQNRLQQIQTQTPVPTTPVSAPIDNPVPIQRQGQQAIQTLRQPNPQPTQATIPTTAHRTALGATVNKLPTGQAQVIEPPAWQAAINKYADFYKIPREIAHAIAFHESAGWNATQEYGGGAGTGPFQIDRSYHPEVSVQQANNPDFAVKYALGLLRNRYDTYGGSWDKAIQGYNGTPGTSRTNKYLQDVKSILNSTVFE